MKRKINKFKIDVVGNYKRNIELHIDNKYIFTFKGNLEELISYFNDFLNNKFTNNDKLIIRKLSKPEMELLKLNNITVQNCIFCNKDVPVYMIKSDNYDNNVLYICKNHLIKFNDYLNFLLNDGSFKLTSPVNFEYISLED